MGSTGFRRILPVVVCAVATVWGCGADVTPPKASPVGAIRDRLILRIERMQDAIDTSGKVNPSEVQQLGVSVRTLRDRMAHDKLGTPEDLQELGDFVDQIRKSGAGRQLESADWQPDKEGHVGEAGGVAPGTLKDILPKLKVFVKTIEL